MKEDIMNTLKEYGLSPKEVDIFLFLVENNGITAYKIANGTKIFKSTCYDVLERLISKGFVKNPAPNLIKITTEAKVDLAADYKNPLDKSSQYVNPFSEFKNKIY